MFLFVQILIFLNPIILQKEEKSAGGLRGETIRHPEGIRRAPGQPLFEKVRGVISI